MDEATCLSYKCTITASSTLLHFCIKCRSSMLSMLHIFEAVIEQFQFRIKNGLYELAV